MRGDGEGTGSALAERGLGDGLGSMPTGLVLGFRAACLALDERSSVSACRDSDPRLLTPSGRSPTSMMRSPPLRTPVCDEAVAVDNAALPEMFASAAMMCSDEVWIER